jgi:hypothetical protein
MTDTVTTTHSDPAHPCPSRVFPNVPSSLLTITDAEIRGAHAGLLKRWLRQSRPLSPPTSVFSL